MKKFLILILSYLIIFFNSNLLSSEKDNKLKIGLLAPLSGEYKDLGYKTSGYREVREYNHTKVNKWLNKTDKEINDWLEEEHQKYLGKKKVVELNYN